MNLRKLGLVIFLSGLSLVVHAQLLGDWHLDNNAADGSGNGYNGTAQGSPAYVTTNKEGTHALSLNGSTQYIDLGNPALFPAGTSARSISAWAMTNSVTSGYQWIFAYGSPSNAQAMFIGAGNKTLIGGGYTNDITYDGSSGTGFWTTGTWHHICLTFDGTTAKLYADGTFVKSLTPSPAWNLQASKAYIGKQVNGSEYWNGQIDDVRIYGKALSATEVQAIATAPPAVPTGVTATAASSTTINLGWTDNSTNETGFQIERSLTTGTGFSLLTTTSANATSYSDASLAAATPYYYRIRSVNSGGTMAYSSEVNATTSGTLIPVPTSLAGTVSALTTVNLTWTDNSSTETGFQIERSLTPGTGYSLITTTAANTTAYANTSLAENTTYYFRIRAIDASGSSQYSNEIAVTTSAALPAAPTGLSATLLGGISARLTWTDNATNETGFQVERSVTSGTGYTLLTTTAANTTTYTDASTSAGTTYFYRVRAANNGGSSAYTTEVTITTSLGGLVAQWKLNNNANDASGNNLNGTIVNGATFSTDAKEGTHSLVVNGTTQWIDLGTPSAFPTGLAPRTLCAWAKTTSVDNVNRSIATLGVNWSSNAMYIGRTGTSLVCGGFGDDFTVTSATWATGVWNHVCLTYDGTTAVVYFNGVQVASGAKSWSLNLQHAYIGRLFSDFENLWQGQIDDVRLYNKALSATEVQALITTTPAAPTALTASVTSSSTIDISWTDNATNETGFQIERSTTAGTGYQLVSTVSSNTTTFKDTGLLIGTSYYYRVRAYNAGGNSTYSSEFSLSIPSTPPVAQGAVWDDVEFNALKDLFTNTNGAGWTNKTNWPATWPSTASSAQYGTWYGITVTSGDVTVIDLSNNNLTGSLPASISNLNSLTSLNVRTNQIGGTIPSSINDLTHLTLLSLGPNVFTGDIPDLGNLVNLTSLEINAASLNAGSIPAWIANLTHLQSLNLINSNRTGGMPGFLWGLTSLQSVYLDTNHLTGEISPSIGNLTNLINFTANGNQLTGTLPTELGYLSNLVALEFNYNTLTGPIPSTFGNLHKLMYLYLWNNALTSIPQELKNCVALRGLVLRNNQLSGDIPDLSNIPALNYIGLDGNQFSGAVPAWIGNMTNLWHLFLNNNQFSGQLPPSIAKLPNLLNLIVNDNQLSGVFPDVSSAIALQNLTAANNQFTGMPTGVLGLQHLVVLKFDNNELKSIPDFSTQANKTHLVLYINNNRLDFSALEPVRSSGLQGITYSPQKNIHDQSYVSFTTGGSLVIPSRPRGANSSVIMWELQQSNGSWVTVNSSNADATQNTFVKTNPSSSDVGQVYRWSMTDALFPNYTLQSDPITVANQGNVADDIELAALKDLYISLGGDNWTNHTGWPSSTSWPSSVTSDIFGTWYGITVTSGDVTSISLSANNLAGSVPESITDLRSLKYIYLHNNIGIAGEIPKTFDRLVALQQLYLSGCSLTGEIPSSIFNIPSLVFLSLQSNHLTGSIPSNIGNATSLYNLSLSSNNLTGSIPASIGSLTNLTSLSLSNNKLSGTIPPSIGDLVDLAYLDLSTNQYSGSIPNELYGLTKLIWLSISSGGLSGTLSPQIGNLTHLQYLNLSNNQLSGAIPSELGDSKELIWLLLENNAFSESLPSSIGDLKNLVMFTLYGNQLSGSIPSTIGGLTNLQYLYLYNNQLSGSIPSTIGNMSSLAYLRLEHNQLTGPLPDLSALPVLAQLIVTDNNLSGEIISSKFPTSIVDFQIQKNQFSGTLPDVSQWTRLSSFRVEYNHFSGAFPAMTELTNVSYITASNNQFTSIPSSIVTLPLLYWADFSSNSLTSVPDFSNEVNKENLYLFVQNNYLDFVTIESLQQANILGITYSPQKNIHDLDLKTFVISTPLTIPSRPVTATTTVTWEKQSGTTWQNVNSLTADATHVTFQRTATALSDEGMYRWKMTDTAVPGMTIQSDPIEAKEFNHSVVDQFAFQYKYDTHNRAIAEKVPGADWVYRVYDERDRLVMSQDGNQRKNNQWSYTEYDVLNRPIITGIYTHPASLQQGDMSVLVNGNTVFYETYNGNAGNYGYTKNMFGSSFTGTFEPLSITYYDNYDFTNLWDTGYAYASDSLNKTVNGVTYTQPGTNNPYVNGHTTGSNIKILNTTTWLKNVTYYDDKYRVIQTIGDNNLGGTDKTSSLVDFVGKVLDTKTTHHASQKPDITIARDFEYDHAGRLLKTWHSVNGATPTLLAKNEYNELGQLVTKKLYNADPVSADDAQRTFKQNVDYRYNIRGWLSTINDVNTPEATDLFSMKLNYNTPTTSGGTAQYNGNISEMLWRGANNQLNSYGYNYDAMNRLTEANYFNASDPAQNGRYNEKVLNPADNTPGYDLNGNIRFLTRNGKTGVNGAGIMQYGVMDDLQYTYTGNQLQKVTDAGNKTNGFVDGSNIDKEYQYDANGSMNVDNNKDIASILYNHLNLPHQVNKIDGQYIKYFYDAMGRKLSQQVFDASNNLKKKSDYEGEFFYENDTLKFINHEEGRVVMTAAQPEYQYHLKDHLGNVRVTFTTKNETDTDVATMEAANQSTEQSKFLRYENVRLVNSILFDHTNDKNGQPSGNAIRLSGSANEKEGLGKSVSVMPGDRIDMKVFSKYIDPNANQNNFTAGLQTLLGYLSGVGTAPTGTIIDGNAYASSAASFPPSFAGLLDKSGSTGGPKAYLNYLVFDRDYNFKSGGYVRMGTSAKEDGTNVKHDSLMASVTAQEAGYVYIYLSNEEATPVEVFFDDFTVTQMKSPVVQTNDYYPYGLSFNDFVRENAIRNKHLYNGGSERQEDLGLNWDYTFYRTYDPALGRFAQIDPKVDNFYDWTPYNYAYNNPVSKNDPNGDCPLCAELYKAAANYVDEHYGDSYGGQFVSGALNTVAGYFNPGEAVGSNLVQQYNQGGVANILYQNGTTEGVVNQVVGQVKSGADLVQRAANGDGKAGGELTVHVVVAVAGALEGARPGSKSGPTEPYNRQQHYGKTPTKADRIALGAGKEEVVDHKRSLVRHYYEGDGRGSKPGYSMTPQQRKAFANDRSNMQKQSKTDSNKQGGQEAAYSKRKKKEHGLD